MEGWRGYSNRELGLLGMVAMAVLGSLSLPYLGPLLGLGLVLLGYAEHGYDSEAAEVGWRLIVVGCGLAAVTLAWTAFVLVT